MNSNLVFVSYSRADTDFVRKLSQDLIKAGVNLWVDAINLSGGVVWDQVIEKALDDCRCLLFILSPASVESNNVLDEVYTALEDKKRIIPVKIAECRLPFRLKRFQFIDLTSQYEEQLPSIISAIKTETQEKEEIVNAVEMATEVSQLKATKAASPPFDDVPNTKLRLREIETTTDANLQEPVATLPKAASRPKTRTSTLLKIVITALVTFLLTGAFVVFRPTNKNTELTVPDTASVGKFLKQDSVGSRSTNMSSINPRVSTSAMSDTIARKSTLKVPAAQESAIHVAVTPEQNEKAILQLPNKSKNLSAEDLKSNKKGKESSSNSRGAVPTSSALSPTGKTSNDNVKKQESDQTFKTQTNELTPEAPEESVYVPRPLSRSEKAKLKRDSARIMHKKHLEDLKGRFRRGN